MNRRLVVGTMVMAAAMLAGQAASAEVTPVAVPFHAMYSHVKLVKFSVRNDCKVPIKLKAGVDELTLEPGKVVSMKLEAGTKIVAEEAAASFTAGEVITLVSNELADSTLVLK
jgi:hypothetical protein